MTGPTASTSASQLVLADRYELVRHIARGGMADVFEATDRQLGRRVAVKRFRGGSPEDRPRFDAEVLVLARLNHPNLVQVYDAGEHDGDGFVVMELIDGPSLQHILQTRVTLPEAEVVALAMPLADALAYVHENDVVHRDVTPANVLCGPDGRPRLADFGIARLVDTSRITAAATAVGTAAYMAPEQLEGHDVGPAADVYSFGLVLLEVLTGRRAFDGTGAELAAARLVRDPDTSTGVPGTWGALLAEMTGRDPSTRPTAAGVRDRLAALYPDPAGLAPAVAGVAAAAGVVAAAPEGQVDPLAETQTIPVAGGTTVMPAVLAPASSAPAGSGLATGGRLWWWVGAALVVALLFGLASRSGGIEAPPPTTTQPVAQTIPSTTLAPTTTAPPAPVVVEPPDHDEDDEGKGNGKGKGNDDD